MAKFDLNEAIAGWEAYRQKGHTDFPPLTLDMPWTYWKLGFDGSGPSNDFFVFNSMFRDKITKMLFKKCGPEDDMMIGASIEVEGKRGTRFPFCNLQQGEGPEMYHWHTDNTDYEDMYLNWEKMTKKDKKKKLQATWSTDSKVLYREWKDMTREGKKARLQVAWEQFFDYKGKNPREQLLEAYYPHFNKVYTSGDPTRSQVGGYYREENIPQPVAVAKSFNLNMEDMDRKQGARSFGSSMVSNKELVDAINGVKAAINGLVDAVEVLSRSVTVPPLRRAPQQRLPAQNRPQITNNPDEELYYC